MSSTSASPLTNEGQGSSEGEYPTPVATKSSAANPPGASVSPVTSTETLMARLRSQVEFYFSPQNLSRDTYLRNLLSQYGGTIVPLSVICNFPKVQNICISFNVPVDPHLVRRALEGSTVVYVTPDATWISPILPLPPLDQSVKQRPVPLGPRSLSVSSMPDMGVRSSAPNSPIKSANGPGQQPQLQGGLNANNLTGSPTRPAMIDRSQSHSGPVHYAPSIPVSHPIPHGIPVPAPGYAPATYSYPFRNMPPPPANYAQAGYMYTPMQGHPPLSGASAMQYAQIYPGYTYVGTTVASGPHKYFQPGNPVAMRGTAANCGRPAPYDGGQKKSVQQPNGGNVRTNKPDNSKQNRKVRNRNAASGTGNMTRRGSKEQLKQTENGTSNVKKESSKMTSNRSQNDMSDLSGGGQTTRRKNKSKNQNNDSSERREDVTFDANHFPALTPSSPVKGKGASEKPPTVAISGYAAALLAKNKPTSTQDEDNRAPMEVPSSADPHNADLVKGVTDINLNIQDPKDAAAQKIVGDPEVATAAGFSNIPESNVSDCANKNPTKSSDDDTGKMKRGAKLSVTQDSNKVEVHGPTSKEVKDDVVVEPVVESAPVDKVTPPSEKKSSSPVASVPTWGKKLSFIDVVRKQV